MSTQLDTRESLFATMRQIAAEREAARPIVEELVAGGGEGGFDAEIPRSWRTAGFVHELTTAAARILETDARRSLLLEQLSLAVITAIPPGTYPAPTQMYLEGLTWKEIAAAQRYLGLHDAAQRAYGSAEGSFLSERALIHDWAATKLLRAYSMTFMRRHDEALELIDQATALLRSFGDERRILRSEVVKGNVHQFRGEFEVARAKYERLLTAPELSDDLHTLGVLYNNLAAACAILGRNSEAVSALEHARAIFTDLDMPAEVDRTGWVLANVLLKTGEFPKAVVLLGRLRDSFLARQLPEDAGLVGLDLVEGLIAMERVEEARALTEQVVNEFRRAQLNAQAIRALAYLRDLLPRSPQPRRAVRHVRSYLEKLQSEPELLFLPLED